MIGETKISEETRCCRCLLPLSLNMIHFDAQNTCEFCLKADGNIDLNAKGIDGAISYIRKMGEGQPYDVLIGLSGGRDSSYMAYELVNKHKLRVLATYYRTPFTQDRSHDNVNKIVQRLGIPLVEIALPWDAHIDCARTYFQRWLKNPRPEFAALCCAQCKLLNGSVFKIAQQEKIRSIIFGGNPFETVPFLSSYNKASSGPHHKHDFASQFNRMVGILRKGLGVFRQCPPKLLPLSFRASIMYINPHSPYLRLRYPGVHSMEYFHYTPWVESECLKTIQNNLGWQPNPNEVETWKSDCDFAALKNYMFYKMYGATYNDALYSNLVRNKQITRDEAISRIRAGAGMSIESIARVMQAMCLPMDLIDQKSIEKAREV